MAVKLVDKTNLQNQALKLRVYPAKEQEILINKTFGCVRKIYNNRIAERQTFYENIGLVQQPGWLSHKSRGFGVFFEKIRQIRQFFIGSCSIIEVIEQLYY
ncbi:MAG: helix-turn-helix domain-containing protein [Treponema sp.]|jgi:transposase|nr:helix-turn-helix domain-containing protein [Treponema sp.]